MAHERVVMISIATALVMTGQGILGPVLPVFARRFGVSVAAVGVVVAAFGLARLILNVPLGWLSDRWGRRFLLVGGPLVVSVAMVFSGLAGSIGSLTWWRFVAGAGSSMYMVGALVYITDISTAANRARLIGINQGALLFGQSIGPGLGGLIAEWLGIRAPFFFIAALTFAASVYGLFRLPETRPDGSAGHGPDRATPTWRRVLVGRVFAAAALVNFAIFFSRASTRTTLMPLYGVDELGMSVGEVGLVLTAMAVVNLVLLPAAATLADRFGRVRAIVPATLGLTAGLVVLARADTISGFLAGAAVMALATSVAGPAPAALAADAVPAADRGVALGAFRTLGDLGLLVGPPILGRVADVGGFGAAFSVNAAVVAAVTAVFVLAVSGKRDRTEH